MSAHTGRYVWFDLVTPEVDPAVDFYCAAVGWQREDWKGEGFSYPMFKGAEHAIGGAVKTPEQAQGAPPHWVGYIATPDVDATVARAEALGGRVLMAATTMPGVGRWAVMADPTGAVFAPFQPSGEAPAGRWSDDRAPGVGEHSWSELISSDPERALDFYKQLFSWHDTDAMEMGSDMGRYQMFGLADSARSFGGAMKLAPGMPQSVWLHYFHVADVPAAVEAATKAGGKLVHGPMEVPGGDIIAQLMDPQGGFYAVHGSPPGRAQA